MSIRRIKMNGAVKVDIDFSNTEKAISRADIVLLYAVLESCERFLPAQTKSLTQRSYVDEKRKQVVFPGPYANYLYSGKKMVDEKTGKGPALIRDKDGAIVGYRFRKGAKLKATEEKLNYSKNVHPDATDHWFEEAKKQDLRSWIDAVKKEV